MTDNTSIETSGNNQTAPTDYTAPASTPEITRTVARRLGRHPNVTRGAFGNGRKHNGIKYRTSDLIRSFR